MQYDYHDLVTVSGCLSYHAAGNSTTKHLRSSPRCYPGLFDQHERPSAPCLGSASCIHSLPAESSSSSPLRRKPTLGSCCPTSFFSPEIEQFFFKNPAPLPWPIIISGQVWQLLGNLPLSTGQELTLKRGQPEPFLRRLRIQTVESSSWVMFGLLQPQPEPCEEDRCGEG